MKRPEFRLGRVQRVRELEADVARGGLQEALSRLAEGEAVVEKYEASVAGLRGLWRERVASGTMVTPAEILALEAEVERQLQTTEEARKRVKVLEADVERARAIWSAKKRDERALERLHERAVESHALEDRRADAREADEVATRRSSNSFQNPRATDR